jgi:hypothetical protein
MHKRLAMVEVQELLWCPPFRTLFTLLSGYFARRERRMRGRGGRVGAKEEERQRGGLRDGGREEGWKTGRN